MGEGFALNLSCPPCGIKSSADSGRGEACWSLMVLIMDCFDARCNGSDFSSRWVGVKWAGKRILRSPTHSLSAWLNLFFQFMEAAVGLTSPPPPQTAPLLWRLQLPRKRRRRCHSDCCEAELSRVGAQLWPAMPRRERASRWELLNWLVGLFLASEETDTTPKNGNFGQGSQRGPNSFLKERSLGARRAIWTSWDSRGLNSPPLVQMG